MLHPSFDACFWENFKGHLLASPKPEVLSVSQVVVMKTPGYCWRVLLLKILFIFSIYMHPLEKAMAPHSSVLAWRIPGTGEPGGLLSMGSHRVEHDWSDSAAAAAAARPVLNWNPSSHMDALFSAGKRLTLSLVKGSYSWFFLSCSLVLKKTEHFIYLAYYLGMLYR